jgi:hypothetical protein
MALAGLDVAATALATGVSVATAAKTAAGAKRLVMAVEILEMVVMLVNNGSFQPETATTVQALNSGGETGAKVHMH